MGTKLGIDILKTCRVDLNDADKVRWTDADLLEYLNSGQREIAILKPNTSTAVRPLELTAGFALQEIPDDAIALIDIVANLGADGETPGRAVTLVNREDLDAVDPSWRTRTSSTGIRHYCFDERNPRAFYVYKIPSTAWFVEAHLSVTPADVIVNGLNGSNNTAISVDDIYETALHDYVMMRAEFKNTDVQELRGSNELYQRFLQRLGLKVQVERRDDPNRNAPPVAQGQQGGK